MDARNTQLDQVVSASALLGYLNFSDGRPDPRWQKQYNDAYAFLAGQGEARPWEALHAYLADSLGRLRGSSSAFRDVTQAETVLAMVARILPAYRRHHADLLAHLSDADLFQPFFLVRVYEAVLAQRGRSDGNPDADVAAVVTRLNDFVGHRPIAILETRPQGEPYEHERHRPVPLYLRGVGVGWGPYQELIARALDILKDTDPNLLGEAQFDLQLLDELAVDVRAYDHSHPVNRRPNYVFGEWDPHHLDNQGRFRRYVARKITLDALLDRLNQPEPGNRAERLVEAAAVLAGTILMAAGVSGPSPTAHDSSVSLGTLLPRIARYRDVFYQQLLPRLAAPHAARLRQEQTLTRQPFGAARQHLNGFLARHRATQMQQRYLSILYADMGYPEASRQEARRIPSVAGRLLSEILGRLTSAQFEAEHGRLAAAARFLPEIEDILHRGIACGAFADPWNIIGFQGFFPLSNAREDSVRDARLEELIQAMEHILNLYARLTSEAAAAGDKALIRQLRDNLDRLTAWWDHFATADVSDLRRVHGGEASASLQNVADALTRWHERGEAPADLAFWRSHLEDFRSPKAFALVVDTLLRKGDFRAALALLSNWIGQVEQVPLEDGLHSFHTLALRWMLALTRPEEGESPGLSRRDKPAGSPSVSEPPGLSRRDKPAGPRPLPDSQRRELVSKFFDYLEANAEDYWQAPTLDVLDLEEENEASGDDLYSAAYDEFTYQDSTDDDQDSSLDEGPPLEEFDLERESERLDKRLRFLSTLARLWQVAARFLASKLPGQPSEVMSERHHSVLDTLTSWLTTARSRDAQLLDLLDSIQAQPLPSPSGDYDSLVEYDRRRVLKEQLLYTTISTCLDMALAVGAMQGAIATVREQRGEPPPPASRSTTSPAWEPFAIRLEQALFRGDPDAARQTLPLFVEQFQKEPLLFTPLTEGGQPRLILRIRVAQTILRALLANLPRLGLLRETFELLRTARAMEQVQPPRGKGVTEFNHFFQAAYQALVECLVDSAAAWTGEQAGDEPLVEMLEHFTTPFLTLWIEHSRTLQLSAVEAVSADQEWRRLQEFIQRYGGDLFHARFMTLANLRGILHRGVGNYLDYLRDNPDPLRPVRLLDDLDRKVRRADAVRWLEIVLQSVIENYEEYKDYNTTTTQSDYGENLHVLIDFLRVKASYDRHAWQFRPLVLAHEVLARRGRSSAALVWEESLGRFSEDLARQFLEQLDRLERARGVRLHTIRDRLNERFLKPLALDRLCARIEPAMLAAQHDGGDQVQQNPDSDFAHLLHEVRAYTATPTGVGLDVPQWLRRLEMEVRRVQAAHTTIALLAENFFRIPRRRLPFDELQRQMREWDRPSLPH